MKGKAAASQRIDMILKEALKTASVDMGLAQSRARRARRIAMKYNIKLPYEKKQLFCHKCKRFIVPGINARVRLTRSPIRAVRITCLECGHIYRRILQKKIGGGR